MTRHDWLRFWLHFPVGVGIAWLTWFLPVLGVLIGFTFLVYEIVQDWRKYDFSFKDIYGFAFGLGTGGVAIILINLRSLIW